MPLSETLNRAPKAVAGVVGAIILITALAVWYSGGSAIHAPAAPGQQYYSVDDGKTYFADDASKGVSFMKDGQLAVEAMVYTCDKTGSRFVGYLRRIDPAIEKRASNISAAQSPQAELQRQQLLANNIQVKRPGSGQWVHFRDPRGIAIESVQCPGGDGTATVLNP